MDEQDLRNELLQELISKMHDRLADKEYPGEEKPPIEEAVSETIENKDEKPSKSSDDEDEISDEDMAELMKTTGE